MKMQKQLFRIGDLATKLGVEKFVIRFWEKEFNVKTTRSNGGQRFYSNDDFEQFKEIKQLLYERGFTIAGAKKQLISSYSKNVMTKGARKTTMEQNDLPKALPEELKKDLISLRTHLEKLLELL